MQDLSRFKLAKAFRGLNPLVVQAWWIVDSLFFRPPPNASSAMVSAGASVKIVKD